jgi:hypothetical protein
MDVKGTNYKWESIYFYDPVAPETQCFVERNLHSLVYKISLTQESTHESEELQIALAEILLHEVGGKVYNPVTKESDDLKSFRHRSKNISSEIVLEEAPGSKKSKTPPPSLNEILWILFSWALVLFGVYIYQQAPQPRKTFFLIACVLALISASGITFSKTKTK